jgi:hypothetical protein
LVSDLVNRPGLPYVGHGSQHTDTEPLRDLSRVPETRIETVSQEAGSHSQAQTHHGGCSAVLGALIDVGHLGRLGERLDRDSRGSPLLNSDIPDLLPHLAQGMFELISLVAQVLDLELLAGDPGAFARQPVKLLAEYFGTELGISDFSQQVPSLVSHHGLPEESSSLIEP